MSRNNLIIGLAVILGLFCRPAFPRQKISTIRNITIVRENIFADSTEQAHKFPFRLANKVHLVTRERIIRRELLFGSGDEFDQSKLDETARNLRRFEYLSNVRVYPEFSGDSVDVFVSTQDLWTLSVYLAASGGGGKTKYSVGLDDENFLGMGQTVDLSYTRDNLEFLKEEWSLHFWEPGLLSSRAGLALSVGSRSYGYSHSVSLEKPFYAVSSPWAMGGGMSKFKDREGFYHSETEVVRNQVKREQFWLFVRRASGVALRHEFGISYNYVLERFRPVFYDPFFDTTGLGLTEQEEKLGWITFTYKTGQARFTQTSNLDRYSRIEDINLGWSIQAGLGRASTLYGSNVNRTYLEGSTRFAVELPWRQYLSLQVNSSTFATRNDFVRADHQLNLSYYNQGIPRQTLAMSIRAYDYTRHLSYHQFLLGGTGGLRGFSANSFSGTKAMVINLEDRFFSKWQLLTFGIGAAVFVDAGYAWNLTKEINLPKDLRWNYGVGLRLGATRAFANRVIRLDYAKSAHSKDYFISFGVGQVFEWAQPQIF
ncbi:MAG: BamA/TamA family outer membrane protein [candidate division Zixibacteria bacterium]|nr:BamA/TamA family outer membrane protein [candidate division Zixibacteria bacterium]